MSAASSVNGEHSLAHNWGSGCMGCTQERRWFESSFNEQDIRQLEFMWGLGSDCCGCTHASSV